MPIFSEKNPPDALDIDVHIRALAAASSSLKTEVDKQCAALKRCRNTLQAVSKLPNELLVCIFKKIVDAPVDRRVQALRKLAGVSFHWWCVVRSTPTLWNTITCKEPGDVLAFKMSKELPLAITYPMAQHAFSKSLWGMVKQQRSRWHSLVIDGDCHPSISLSLHGPRLERLELRSFENSPITPHQLQQLPLSPSLKYLDIAYVSVDFMRIGGERLPSLTVLNLNGFLHTPRTFKTLLSLLGSSHCLEELRIRPEERFADPRKADRWAQSRREQFPTISLPMLRIIEIHLLYPHSLNALLRRIKADPDSVTLVILDIQQQPTPFGMAAEEQAALKETLGLLGNVSECSLAQCIRSISRRQPSVWVNAISSWEVSLTYGPAMHITGLLCAPPGPGFVRLNLGTKMVAMKALLLFGASILDYPGAPPVNLLVEPFSWDFDWSRSDKIPVLRSVSNIAKIFSTSGRVPRGLLDVLSQPQDEIQGESGWLWPQLSHIHTSVVPPLDHRGRPIHTLLQELWTRRNDAGIIVS